MATLTEAIKTVLEATLKDLHTCIPGAVTSYDYSKQEAEVQPLVKTIYNDDTTEAIPVISNVPVMFPRSADSIIHFPIKSGDSGLILFSEAALEKWLSLGGEADPGDKRRFDLSDAIFIPGLYPFNVDSLANNNEDFIAQYKGTGLRIKKNGDIEVGGTSFKKLVNDSFVTMFNNHVHNFIAAPSGSFSTSTPGAVAGTLPPPVPTPPTPAAGISMGNSELTSKVKAE